MKKRIPVLFVLLLLCVGLFLFSSCDDEKGGQQQQTLDKLDPPTVTLTGNVASWEANEKADKFEISLDGELSYLENTVTQKTLEEGQTIKVRAVGDGTNYETSEWSNSVKYTAGSSENNNNNNGNNDNNNSGTVDSEAPVYLGISASLTSPTAVDAPQRRSLSGRATQTLDDILLNYLSNAENALGDTLPKESIYTIYSAAEKTVYIQIWLDNPDQNTILSFKLNGTKYQSGGALKSFFVETEDSYLNCVYVEVKIPAGSYNEISYQVTEIEYVEGTNISQEGKAVMIDQNNDTVVIGLPYSNAIPTVSSGAVSVAASSISLSTNIADADGYLAATGGWLRVVLLDSNNNILSQKKLAVGSNNITFDNLSAGTSYKIVALLFADLRDGKGVCVHTLYTASERTSKAVIINAEGENLLDPASGKYYANIKVEGTLNDPAFSFTKVEIFEGHYDSTNAKLCYTGAFDGSANIKENILSDKSYVVKVYYKNALSVEQSEECLTYVYGLDIPWVTQDYTYGLLNDGIIGFKFSLDAKCNMDNLTLKVLDEYSKEYIAKNALEIINNPNIIDELQAKLDTLNRYEDIEEFDQVYRKLDTLRGVRETMERYYTNVTKTEWEALAAGSIYLYEITLGDDAEFFTGPDGMYYIVLKDFQNKRVSEYSLRYVLCADIDFNNGDPIEEKTLCDGWFDIYPAIGENDYLFAEEFTKNNNTVYLETKSRNNLGNESYRMLGYVNQIVLADGYNILEVLWTQETPPNDIDEAAWLANVIEALKNGEEAESVFPLGDMSPIEFDLNVNTDIVGEYDIRFTYKMFGKTYTEEDPYDWAGETVTYYVIGKLPTASIYINTEPREDDYGMWWLDMPEGFGWNWYEFEVKNESGVTIGTYDQYNYHEIGLLKANYSIRVRLMDKDDNPYYLDGDWSEWFICTPAKYNAPELSYSYFSQTEVNVDWDWEYDRRYGYTVNGGAETVLTEWQQITAKTGDIVRVRVIAPDGSGFESSDYAEIKITDNRKKLNKPEVTLQHRDSHVYIILPFDQREENVLYIIYDSDGKFQARFTADSDRTVIKSQYTGTYKVVAVSQNHAEYSDSDAYVFTI